MIIGCLAIDRAQKHLHVCQNYTTAFKPSINGLIYIKNTNVILSIIAINISPRTNVAKAGIKTFFLKQKIN